MISVLVSFILLPQRGFWKVLFKYGWWLWWLWWLWWWLLLLSCVNCVCLSCLWCRGHSELLGCALGSAEKVNYLYFISAHLCSRQNHTQRSLKLLCLCLCLFCLFVCLFIHIHCFLTFWGHFSAVRAVLSMHHDQKVFLEPRHLYGLTLLKHQRVNV